MAFTEKDLDNLSSLARIDIKPEEKGKMLEDMQEILKYVSEINEVSGEIGVEKDVVRNVMREDVVTNSGDREALLKEAPAREGDFVKVTQVFS